VRIANGQLWMQFLSKSLSSGTRAAQSEWLLNSLPSLARHLGAPPVTIAALHQGNYATISNYLERELRYMDAGDEAQKRQSWAKGTPGYQ
jgi:hypothetical protein